jgi:hypothetical protein
MKKIIVFMVSALFCLSLTVVSFAQTGPGATPGNPGAKPEQVAPAKAEQKKAPAKAKKKKHAKKKTVKNKSASKKKASAGSEE